MISDKSIDTYHAKTSNHDRLKQDLRAQWRSFMSEFTVADDLCNPRGMDRCI